MSVFGTIGSYFLTFFKAIAGQLGTKTAEFLEYFVTNDLGKIAVDVVNIVAAEMPGASNEEKRAQAVAMLKSDALKAGHDVENFGTSTWNWLIETALQAVKGMPVADPVTPPVTTPTA